jgi:hypothetical protein
MGSEITGTRPVMTIKEGVLAGNRLLLVLCLPKGEDDATCD